MSVHVLGIRHHGPGSARSVTHALETMQPDIILVEGPPDADSLLHMATHAEMTPPVALLVYVPDNPQHAAFYPFAEFSPEWQAIREDGATLFSSPIGVVVAHERVQKDDDWTYNDWGVGALDEDQIRLRLLADGYTELAADGAIPGLIKSAASRAALAVWTNEHLVTLDESHIDARPSSALG